MAGQREVEREVEFHMDSESDEEGLMEEEEDEPVLMGRARQGVNPNRLPLHHFLRLIAGGRMMEHGAAATNDDLVQALKRGGVIQNDAVHRALTLCARDAFVPANHREEALVDAPIRVEEHDFNISAPHMHATCLEALQLQPGHKFLDVGSGCGVLTACGAYLVGRQGAAVGFEVRRECIQMGRDAVKRLTAANAEYASAACPARFELQNVFMPAPKFLGQFDRVHIGASCPPDRLAPLLSLLRPEGGLIIVPVAPNDLRVITKQPNGSVTQKVISQVRFSDLEVPTDAEILLATLRGERRQRTTPAHQPSTFADDVAAIAASGGGGPGMCATPSGSYGDACGGFMPSSSPSGVIDGLPPTPTAANGGGASGDRSWPHRITKLFSSCSSGSEGTIEPGGSGSAIDASGGGGGPMGQTSAPGTPSAAASAGGAAAGLNVDGLGEPDCLLVGAGWTIPVHRCVLRQRCDHFRARCDTAWRDCASDRVAVPDHFSREAVQAFLHYIYNDGMDDCSDPQEAVGVLHVALYYSCPRLVHLCELRLASLLRVRDRRGASGGGGGSKDRGRSGDGGMESDEQEGLADASAALLALADDNGLAHLRAVALDYIVHNHDAVAKTESHQALSKHQVALVAQEACHAHARMVQHIKRMAEQQPLPEPSY